MPQPLVPRIIVVETIARKKVQRADQGTNCIQGGKRIKTETAALATIRESHGETCQKGARMAYRK